MGESHPKVPRPSEELKGFAKIYLRHGETRRVKVALNRRAFSYYDTVAHAWRLNPGEFTIFVGSSVEQAVFKQSVRLEESLASANAEP